MGRHRTSCRAADREAGRRDRARDRSPRVPRRTARLVLDQAAPDRAQGRTESFEFLDVERREAVELLTSTRSEGYAHDAPVVDVDDALHEAGALSAIDESAHAVLTFDEISRDLTDR